MHIYNFIIFLLAGVDCTAQDLPFSQAIPLVGKEEQTAKKLFLDVPLGVTAGVNIMRKGTFRSQAYFSDGTF